MGLIFSNIPELEGTSTETVLSNLSSLECELRGVFERRTAHLCELAHAIVSDGGDIDLIKNIIVSVRSDGGIQDEDICPENINEMTAIFSKISLLERLEIFKQVFERIPAEKYAFFDNSDYLSPDSRGRISYIQNSYNDAVFEHFAMILHDVKASYYDTVAVVCESVVGDKCQFCILPVETMKDGKLISFYDVIIKNELKINAEYQLEDISQNGYTRYALLSKSVMLPPNQNMHKENTKHLEVIYGDTDNISLDEFLMAADYFGLKSEVVDTFKIECLGNKKHFCVEFVASDADEKMFMTYLAVDCPDHVLLGLYQRSKSK